MINYYIEHINKQIENNNKLYDIFIQNNVGIGTSSPTAKLNIAGGGVRIHNGFSNSTARPALNTASVGAYEIRGVGSGGGTTQADGADDGFLRIAAGGGAITTAQSSIDISGYSSLPEMNNNIVFRNKFSVKIISIGL